MAVEVLLKCCINSFAHKNKLFGSWWNCLQTSKIWSFWSLPALLWLATCAKVNGDWSIQQEVDQLFRKSQNFQIFYQMNWFMLANELIQHSRNTSIATAVSTLRVFELGIQTFELCIIRQAPKVKQLKRKYEHSQRTSELSFLKSDLKSTIIRL